MVLSHRSYTISLPVILSRVHTLMHRGSVRLFQRLISDDLCDMTLKERSENALYFNIIDNVNVLEAYIVIG